MKTTRQAKILELIQKNDETVGGSRVRKTGEVAADEEVVKTGDNNHVWVYIVILVASAVGCGGRCRSTSRRTNNKNMFARRLAEQ